MWLATRSATAARLGCPPQPIPDEICQAYLALCHQVAGSVNGVGWRRVRGRLGMRRRWQVLLPVVHHGL